MLNTRKGMPTVTVVVGLVSTLLVGSAVLGSLQAIKTTSLDPNVDQTQSQLDQVGDKTVTIAGSDSDEAGQQMQGAIAWNMLAASDCRILTTFNALSRAQKNEGNGHEFDEDDMPIDPVDDKVFKATTSDFLDELAENEGNGYTGNFNDFTPLIESGFDYPCIGTQSAIKEMEDTAKDHSNSLVSGLFSGAYKVVGGGLVITGVASCVVTAGGGCAAAAAGAAMLVGSDAAGDLAGEVIVPGADEDMGAEPGFDMEGVFGKMNFNVEKTFLMGTDNSEDPFLAIALKFNDEDGGAGNTPGFWRGKRFSYLVPAGLNPNTFDKDKYHRIYDPGSNSKLIKRDFWNDGDKSVGAPGTSQERRKMMFYAFRPRMENVPIISGERLTEDTLTEGCTNDGCSWDVKRLANFIEHTSYLFCEGASGQIQSNAGHIYSSDEAFSQEAAIEDQVYPKVEIRDKATDCIPDMSLNVPDNVKLDCGPEAFVSGASVKVFSRQTADRGTHTVDVVCGTDGREQGADLGGYGYVDYYITEQTISEEGCFPDWYDITTDADVGGDTLQERGYPILMSKEGSDKWKHNFNERYHDSDGENEVGGHDENNRITYERISVEYNTSAVGNLTYRISIAGDSLRTVTDAMNGQTEFNRTVIVEEVPASSETVVREIVENPGSSVNALRNAQVFDQNFSGQVKNLVVDRTPEGDISINDEYLTGFEGFPDQIAITDIEISPVRDADGLNQRYDWDSESVQDIPELNATQTDLELRNVQSYSEPRICKGETGIWRSRSEEVIEGE